ncbi:MAG: AAA family ATPase [Candidatus Thalassarchaeaceae archaeon]|jgi:chromosome partitioning protein|nr:AAA family ATPase [Candidatus Thalassarchaeaceae archaeon]
MEGEDTSIPEATPAPLVIDVEFVEKEITAPKPRDIGQAQIRQPLNLPRAEPTPSDRARVVTVINQKGGVAKTTTVINVATHLAMTGVKVLVVDCDAQGNCATGFGIDKSRINYGTRTLMTSPENSIRTRHATAIDNLHLVVGDRSLVGIEDEIISQLGRERRLTEGLEALLPHYDLILIDTPPSLGLVSVNALVASDAVVIPVQTEYFALEGLALLASTIREIRHRLNPRLGVDAVIMTMHAPTLLNGQVAAQVRETFPDLVVNPPIRRNIRLAEAPSHGTPIHIHAPNSAGGKDYSALAEALKELWGFGEKDE